MHDRRQSTVYVTDYHKYVQEVFHVYLNKFEIAVTLLFLIIFCCD